MEAKEIADKTKSLVNAHTNWRAECLNLLAAENVSSQTAREILASDLTHRYSEYEEQNVEKRWDEGGRYVVEIEKLGQEVAKSLFKANFAELRPISGHLAIISCVYAFMKEGGLNLELAPINGGHGTADLASRLSFIKYRTEKLPFDVKEWNIDIDASKKKIRETAPDVVTLGSSFYLFPHPVSEIKDTLSESGGKLLYDGSHVMGLIAGNHWPNPLTLGADVLSGSTHKSLAGPQKGIIATNSEETWLKIANTLYPALTTNHHLMNVASLVYTMAEYLKFGEALSSQIVRNAKALGESLSDQGLDVIGSEIGFTESHQILARTDKLMSANAASKALDLANIICNKMELEGAQGIRLGTSEVTRLGMKENDMKEVAKLIKNVIVDQRDPSQIASQVRSLTKDFVKIHYSFDEGKLAYVPLS